MGGKGVRKEKQSIWTLSSQTGRCDSSHLPGGELHGGSNGSTRNQQRDKSSPPGGGKLQLVCWLVHKLSALLLKWHAKKHNMPNANITQLGQKSSAGRVDYSAPRKWQKISHYARTRGSIWRRDVSPSPPECRRGSGGNPGRQQISGRSDDTSKSARETSGFIATRGAFPPTRKFQVCKNKMIFETRSLVIFFTYSGDKRPRFHLT